MRRQTHRDHYCQRCGTGKIQSGPSTAYNARSQYTGNIICPDCRVDEVMGRWKPREETDTNEVR